MNNSITNNTEAFCDKTPHILGFVDNKVQNNISIVSSRPLTRLSEFNKLIK